LLVNVVVVGNVSLVLIQERIHGQIWLPQLTQLREDARRQVISLIPPRDDDAPCFQVLLPRNVEEVHVSIRKNDAHTHTLLNRALVFVYIARNQPTSQHTFACFS
jgi:hypothetical protein